MVGGLCAHVACAGFVSDGLFGTLGASRMPGVLDSVDLARTIFCRTGNSAYCAYSLHFWLIDEEIKSAFLEENELKKTQNGEEGRKNFNESFEEKSKEE